ncbi:MAG: hypothetical protein OEL53_07180 [Rhodospirillales bacterium]|jgi:hypothetical protein|nr:hypothetical protein [Rhodospirillales bacterium]
MGVPAGGIRSFSSLALLAGGLALTSLGPVQAGDPPGPTEINGQKVLTLVGREPPALRCNNNMQIAAELSNIYKIPVLIMPVSLAKPGTKAPTVWYGKDLMAEDGGVNDGMVTFSQLADVLEIDDVPKLPLKGRLLDADVKPKFDILKQQIKTVP